MRAAASSIAKGRPSRRGRSPPRRPRSRRSRRSRGGPIAPGARRGARRRPGSPPRRSPGPRGPGGPGGTGSAARPRRPASRGWWRGPSGRGRPRAARRRTRLPGDVLEIVEHQEHLPLAQRRRHPLAEGSPSVLRHAERPGDGGGDEGGLSNRRERDEGHAAGEAGCHVIRDLEGEAVDAPARAGQVRSRTSSRSSNARTAASSPARPMNGVRAGQAGPGPCSGVGNRSSRGRTGRARRRGSAALRCRLS